METVVLSQVLVLTYHFHHNSYPSYSPTCLANVPNHSQITSYDRMPMNKIAVPQENRATCLKSCTDPTLVYPTDSGG
ncbi:hypothetical protein Trydic_g13734 [Trypoxylus dichotomus]